MSERILTKLLNYAAQEQAGRLVVSRGAGETPRLNCHYHLPDGEIRTMSLPAGLAENFLASLKRIAALSPGELATKKYCRVRTKACQLNFYLTILPEGGQEKIILHIIPGSGKTWRLSQLGLRAADQKKLLAAASGSGLIIISAPDTNGKSTTLCSLLSEINRPEKSIYLIGGTPETAPTGISCLSADGDGWAKVLKHDSDIIAIDDQEDEKSLMIAARAAATGRLVIIALTADSAEDALKKILRLPLPLKLKLGQIKMITNQRLVPLKRSAQKKMSAGRKKDKRKDIGLFEILPATAAWRKKALTAASEKDTTPLIITEEDGWRPLAADRRQKIKDGLIAA